MMIKLGELRIDLHQVSQLRSARRLQAGERNFTPLSAKMGEARGDRAGVEGQQTSAETGAS